ncbi:TPA: hypothetical protein KG967_000897 [Enterococcus faecalis]|nr:MULTISPECIES: hypothetical protein [Enterococcus]ETJ09385.1 MAG: hypothetical protein Q608_EFC00043G0160 [Enterococcus faecalis DORA_14]HAP3746073.1 hypothetical protein [Enterococcus faecalis TDR28]HAP3752051.1 hypothetical protein [Enterococcus faecalis TDR22]HAP3754847.1 hypothetical protein [Enterococcus faecalis TDR13]HAP3758067.1 hypothetical protein [Enterococcus faecalis TDR7]HAP3769244.1 hypothetical protein [Enterococcus faecalis TDR19]HAP4960459.1 hypothetical protein [Enteroco
MNLSQVQAVYYLLYAMQFKDNEKKEFSLVVNYKGKLLTAEFLPLNDSKTHISLEEFDYDFDIQKKTINGCLATELFSIWRSSVESRIFSTKQAFSRPDLLLKKVLDFVSENSLKFESQKPVTTLVKNVHFLESGTRLDSMLLADDNFEVLSIELNNNAKFIGY